MRDYSEFIQFIVERTGLRKPLLVEKDVLLHTLLHRLTRDAEFGEGYLFKGSVKEALRQVVNVLNLKLRNLAYS